MAPRYLHPDVAEAAVFATPDPFWVEAVTAAVVLKPGATADQDTLIAHCRGQPAGFKTPKKIVIVDALPKNPSGKVLERDPAPTVRHADELIASPP